MDIKYINSLIQKSVTSGLALKEEEELSRWISLERENEEFYAKVKAIYTLDLLKKGNLKDEKVIRELICGLKQSQRKYRLIRYSAIAAAVVVLMIGVGSYLSVSDHQAEVPIVTETIKVQPGFVIKRNNMPIALHSGEIENSGYVVNEDKKEIVLKEAESLNPEEITIFVDRGYQYKVTLPDSTKVWLNSDSELRYTTFGSEKREVTLKGEACFDVVRDMKRPFVVKLNNERSVTVLGTFFSVKAYDGDEDTKVSLVEGSVKVKNGEDDLLLTPNRELIINNQSNEVRIMDFDSRTIRAWIAGGFVYYNEELEEIVKDISRRYNKEFIFEDDIVGKERLTMILDSVKFNDIITYIKKAGKGVFHVEQKDDKIIFREAKSERARNSD